MPEEFARSLSNFADKVGKEIKKENIPPLPGAPIKKSVNELVEATAKIMEEKVNEER